MGFVLILLEQSVNRIRDNKRIDAVDHAQYSREAEVEQPNDGHNRRNSKENDCGQHLLWILLETRVNLVEIQRQSKNSHFVGSHDQHYSDYKVDYSSDYSKDRNYHEN